MVYGNSKISLKVTFATERKKSLIKIKQNA